MKIVDKNAECSCELTIGNIIPFVNTADAFSTLWDSGYILSGHKNRSRELMGAACLVFPDAYESNFNPEMPNLLNCMHDMRVSILNSYGIKIRDDDINLLHGKLLLTDWRMSLFDGSCEPLTDGFIDFDCFPAWDMWLKIVCPVVGIKSFNLLSWIPGHLVGPVNDAILVDPASCMSWIAIENDKVSTVGWGISLKI